MARRARGRASLKLPEKQLRQMVKRYGEDFLDEVPAIFSDASAEALGRMIELAPYETGRLESSAGVTTQTSPKARRSRALFEFSAEYAGIVHELPEHSRGEGTRTKPGNEFGAAGPKYIERVLRGFKLAPLLVEGLRNFWRGQRGVG